MFESNAKALNAAGYISGQTYEHGLKMAEWHPGMADFMQSLPGDSGSVVHRAQWGFAVLRLCA